MNDTWNADSSAHGTAPPDGPAYAGHAAPVRPPAVAALLDEVARRAPTTAALTALQTPLGAAEAAAGPLLGDRAWLREQVRLSALRWGTDDVRVAGTLWWYSSSTVLLAPPVATGFLTGTAAHPGPDGLLLREEGQGRLTVARPTRVLPGPAAQNLPGKLRTLLETCVGNLAGVTGLRPRPLWSLACDALANVALSVGRETGRTAEATEFAGRLADAVGWPLPAPRWVDVPVPDGSDGLFPVPPVPGGVERFVRRGSCCLIYEAPGESKCASCPRRGPEDRRVRLEITASRRAAGG
ncbi:(2Fe-2S)-binding protein [Streptomyces sp. HNM0574]|uniref:(2Fe-2S)-binding protein n=1 Tax=Streptomyces sp. HNM0574 TaxID=2714954 RepID=UPI00146B2FF4|nr:(2Fe-2S)-binding protein [Streptomyces sp. HNM0574]NLU70554.1 (2Fe-2S)-binding protein [Streptomyces sp. HNM0574]